LVTRDKARAQTEQSGPGLAASLSPVLLTEVQWGLAVAQWHSVGTGWYCKQREMTRRILGAGVAPGQVAISSKIGSRQLLPHTAVTMCRDSGTTDTMWFFSHFPQVPLKDRAHLSCSLGANAGTQSQGPREPQVWTQSTAISLPLCPS
jgi:hypothetical protein